MGLRPWPAVVDIFNYENKDNVTEEHARTMGQRALDKILKALIKHPESRKAMQEHLRPSEYRDIVNQFDEVKE